MHENHEWKCKKCLHEWKARPNNIKFNPGSGCPNCAGKTYNYEKINNIARQRGLELVGKYTKMTTKTKWKCPNNHEWESTPFNVVTCETGCPYCKVGITENKCRFILEQLTGEKFDKDRSILEGKELDGYSPVLNVAFEYQGEQHFKSLFYHGKGHRNLEWQKERDKWKRSKCKTLGIKLIEIPYHKKGELENYIINKLTELNVKIANFNIDYDKFKWNYSVIEEAAEKLSNKKVKVLSQSYLGSKFKLDFKCMECEHEFSAHLHRILSKPNKGCPACNRRRAAIMREKKKRESRLVTS